jgi:hypothetical protein
MRTRQGRGRPGPRAPTIRPTRCSLRAPSWRRWRAPRSTWRPRLRGWLGTTSARARCRGTGDPPECVRRRAPADRRRPYGPWNRRTPEGSVRRRSNGLPGCSGHLSADAIPPELSEAREQPGQPRGRRRRPRPGSQVQRSRPGDLDPSVRPRSSRRGHRAEQPRKRPLQLGRLRAGARGPSPGPGCSREESGDSPSRLLGWPHATGDVASECLLHQ